MSLEAVKQVTDAEQNAKVRKAQAVQEARKLSADAEREGAAAVDAARRSAQLKVEQLMEQAERNAAAHTAQVVRETEGKCDELRAQAQTRLEQAASLIVGKVVDA